MFQFLFGRSSAKQKPVESPYFPPSVTVGDQKLVRCGTGTRSKLGIHVYDMALYLPQAVTDAQQAIALAGPKQIRFVARRRMSGNELATALFTGIRKNLDPGSEGHYLPLVNEVIAVFKQHTHVEIGRTFRIDLMPDTGSHFYIDDEQQANPVTGKGFNEAVLKVWLGEKPAEESLKENLFKT